MWLKIAVRMKRKQSFHVKTMGNSYMVRKHNGKKAMLVMRKLADMPDMEWVQ